MAQASKVLHNLVAELDAKGTEVFYFGIALKPGARLVREWAGRTHTVIALEGGFNYDGERYTALSKIAARITGAHSESSARSAAYLQTSEEGLEEQLASSLVVETYRPPPSASAWVSA